MSNLKLFGQNCMRFFACSFVRRPIMNNLCRTLACLLVSFNLVSGISYADNQTNDLSPILPESALSFGITIEEANFQLPEGNHSGMFGVYKGLWVFIAGTHFGLHGFGVDPFPPEAQNRKIVVVNPATGAVFSRSLTDPSSGLTPQQIDTLSTISPQGYQEDNTLYMSGGYGIDSTTGLLITQPVFSALYLPGIVQWVTHPELGSSVSANLRQIYNPVFQIAGGEMYRLGPLTQLVFGQNFTGVYSPGSSGEYSEQVRLFRIIDSGGQLAVEVHTPKPVNPAPDFRRRDLNIVPTLMNVQNHLQYGLVAYAGVFTPTTGVWTVPVVINREGDPVMADPLSPTTFKQGMNQYVCASAGLYSRKYASMYTLFFGGISFGYYSGGVFQTDPEIPFINQVTTIQMDKNGHFTQYLMNNEYPLILSNPFNRPLLFGAGAYFIPNNIMQYSQSILNLDNIRKPTVIGYIVGGIQSSLPNTVTDADSSASPHIFKVTLTPK